jgi:hypothetical protein
MAVFRPTVWRSRSLCFRSYVPMATGTRIAHDVRMNQTSRNRQGSRDDRGMEGTPPTESMGTGSTDSERQNGGSPESAGAITHPPRAAETGEPGRLDRISRRAYELYEGRGGGDGRELQDWLEAERQIDGSDDDTRGGTT